MSLRKLSDPPLTAIPLLLHLQTGQYVGMPAFFGKELGHLHPLLDPAVLAVTAPSSYGFPLPGEEPWPTPPLTPDEEAEIDEFNSHVRAEAECAFCDADRQMVADRAQARFRARDTRRRGAKT